MIDAPARLSTVPNFAIPTSCVLLRRLRREDRDLVADVEVALVGRVLVDDDLVVGLRRMRRRRGGTG